MADLEELKQRYLQTKDPRNRTYFAEQIRLAGGTVPSEGVDAPANVASPRPEPVVSQSQPDTENDEDDDSSVPFGVPLDDDNQPTTPPTRGEKGVAELTDAVAKENDEAAQRQRAAAETPPEDASVIPEPAAPKPGIAGDVTPPLEQPASPQQPPAGEGDDNAQVQRPSSSAETADGQKSPQKQTTQDQAKDQLEGQAKKAAGQAIKAALKSAWAAIWGFIVANAAWIVPVAIILIIAIAIFAYFYSSARSGANGKTPVQAVNAIDNQSALEKLSLLVGNTDNLSQDVLTQIQQSLTEMRTQITDPDAQAKIDDVLKSATDCAATPPKADACSSLPDKIKATLLAFAQAISKMPQLSEQGHLPVDQSVIDNIAKNAPGNWANATIDHGLTIRIHERRYYDGGGHNLYLTKGSSYNSEFGLANTWGDALDIPASGKTVYAPFSGTIEKTGGGGEHPILIKSKNDPQTFALMGNVNLSEEVKSSGEMTTGQNIGTISSNHLHFELWVHNRPINSGLTKFNKPCFWLNIRFALQIDKTDPVCSK